MARGRGRRNRNNTSAPATSSHSNAPLSNENDDVDQETEHANADALTLTNNTTAGPSDLKQRDPPYPLQTDNEVPELETGLPTLPEKDAWEGNFLAFGDPNSTRIPRDHIVASFREEAVWRDIHKKSINTSTLVCKILMTTILIHSATRNQVIEEVIKRGALHAKNEWPVSRLPEYVKDNQFDWLHWIAGLRQHLPNALRYINWIVLLEQEYNAIEPSWVRFWYLHREVERSISTQNGSTQAPVPTKRQRKQFADIEVKMGDHNRKRHFLQRKIHESKIFAAHVSFPPPMWYVWEEVIRDVLSATDLSGPEWLQWRADHGGGIGGEIYDDEDDDDDETDDEEEDDDDDDYESGHIEELSDTESEGSGVSDSGSFGPILMD